MSNHGLDESASSRARPHSMGDSVGKGSEIGEVGVDVDGVEIARYLGVGLVGGR